MPLSVADRKAKTWQVPARYFSDLEHVKPSKPNLLIQINLGPLTINEQRFLNRKPQILLKTALERVLAVAFR